MRSNRHHALSQPARAEASQSEYYGKTWGKMYTKNSPLRNGDMLLVYTHVDCPLKVRAHLTKSRYHETIPFSLLSIILLLSFTVAHDCNHDGRGWSRQS